MLVLSRRIGEEIVIGAAVTVRVARLSRRHVSLAIEAPTSVPVVRKEVLPGDKRKRGEMESHRLAELKAGPEEKRQSTSGHQGRSGPPPVLVPSARRTASMQDRVAGEEEDKNDAGNRGVNGQAPFSPDQAGTAGLRSAIQCLIADSQAHYDPEIEFCDDLDDDAFRPELQAAVVSIVRELLLNACRHSKSRNVLLGITQDDGYLCVQVQDWGRGFDPASVPPRKRGLRGVRDLAGWLGGAARVDSQSGAGTCVTVEVPLRQEIRSRKALCSCRPR